VYLQKEEDVSTLFSGETILKKNGILFQQQWAKNKRLPLSCNTTHKLTGELL